MPPEISVLGVAADGGAKAAIAAFEDWDAFTWADHGVGDDPVSWRQQIAGGSWRVLLSGASDSATGRALESAARRAATEASLSIVIVEDFPGNYFPVRDTRVELLVVESAPAAELIRNRWGTDCPPIEVFPSVRFDPHRRRIRELRSISATRVDDPRVILWAGQPETNDCLRTLEALAPALRHFATKLLFKAHPRDAGYQSGTYARLLAELGVPFMDVTALSVAEVIAHRPRLVVTQFSSVGVEAGFFGVPALHVLLPDAGGARLEEKKGYAVLPWCAAGASLLADNPTQIKGLIEAALYDPERRAAIIANFDAYFAPYAEVAPALIRRLSCL